MPYLDIEKRRQASRDAMKRLRDKRAGVNTNEKQETPPAGVTTFRPFSKDQQTKKGG